MTVTSDSVVIEANSSRCASKATEFSKMEETTVNCSDSVSESKQDISSKVPNLEMEDVQIGDSKNEDITSKENETETVDLINMETDNVEELLQKEAVSKWVESINLEDSEAINEHEVLNNVPAEGNDSTQKRNEEESAKAVNLQKDAELNAYLETLKPKPRQLTIKEMLAAHPAYKNVATLKPKIGGGEDRKKTDFVILDDEEDQKVKTRKQKQIEKLKDRFVKHAYVKPPEPPKDRIKLKIHKKEEDSQGIEHLVENEVDYVRSPLIEDEEAILPTERPLLRLSLREQIQKKKLANYQELLKQSAMDNEEDVEEGGDDEKEEEDFDEDEEGSDDSDAEEEEEEELEYLLSAAKKKRKKCALIDDEAEDEDASADEREDNDDDDDSDSSSSDEADDENEIEPEETSKTGSDKENLEENSLPASAVSIEQNDDSACKTPTRPSNKDALSNEDSENKKINAVDYTPKITSAAVLTERTPSDFWLTSKTNVSNRHSDELSPLIPQIRNKSDMIATNEHPENLADALANIIEEPKSKFDDLVDLCSGKFVSQAVTRSAETIDEDDDDEFGNFDFGDDEDIAAEENKVEERSEAVKTPVAGLRKAVVEGITPKLAAKPNIARRSMQFDQEMESSADNEISDMKEQCMQSDEDEEDDDEVGVRRKSTGKQKRLQFSDDEEDPNTAENADEPDEPSSDEEEEEMEEVDETQESPEEILKANPFFNKRGLLKRKFVDDEAELSGSDEGSGDEDEKGMNHYDMEEGDDEDIDMDLVKNQAERAHLRQMMIDDEEKIRKLQNRLLENGDLHSDRQRERKLFRFGVDLDDDAHMGDSDEEEKPENPEELARKQAWIEKRKWISENSHLLEADADESQSLLTSFKMGKKTLQRLESLFETSTSDSVDITNLVTNQRQRKSIYEEIIKARKAARKSADSQPAAATSDASNSLTTSCSEGLNFATVGGIGKDDSLNLNVDESSKSKPMTQPMFGGVSWTKTTSSTSSLKKGSFLSRGGMMLAKLAETTKPGDTVSNVKNNSRNFVFSHITPPNPEKTDGSGSRVKRALKGNCKVQAQAKKIKVDRSFHNLDEASKGSSVFKFL